MYWHLFHFVWHFRAHKAFWDCLCEVCMRCCLSYSITLVSEANLFLYYFCHSISSVLLILVLHFNLVSCQSNLFFMPFFIVLVVVDNTAFCIYRQLTRFWSKACVYIRFAIVHFSAVLTERTPWFISRNLLIPLAFLSWKLALRTPPMWSRPSWPWLLRSRREWAPEPQLEALRSQTWRSRALQ